MQLVRHGSRMPAEGAEEVSDSPAVDAAGRFHKSAPRSRTVAQHIEPSWPRAEVEDPPARGPDVTRELCQRVERHRALRSLRGTRPERSIAGRTTAPQR